MPWRARSSPPRPRSHWLAGCRSRTPACVPGKAPGRPPGPDVAYAIERSANPNVENPYFEAYFSSLVGFKEAHGGPFPGITTPTKHTIVFYLSEPKGQIVAGALVLPLSAPVPEEYAKKYDAHKPTEYGNYLVATGPYMFKSNAAGKVLGVGYEPGKSATLVRNPSWRASTDYRPAYLNRSEERRVG